MDPKKLKEMLKSEDEAMVELAVTICKGASLRDMDALEKIILFLYSKDEELLDEAFTIAKKLKKNVRYLERILEHYADYSGGGMWMARKIQTMYMSIKKMKIFFYTEKEFEKIQKEGDGTFVSKGQFTSWEWDRQIRLKTFKQKHHGKK